MMKKLLVQLWLYFKFPNKLREDVIKCLTRRKAIKLGVHSFPPNYIYFNLFDKNSHVIDIGCGFKAELSCHLIEKSGLTSYGVDPTKKHKTFLKEIEDKYAGRFHHVEVAVSRENAACIFHETQDNESGSLLSDHQNILHDKVITYPVVTKNIQTLISDLKLQQVDLLKIDIEGAEYELLSTATEGTFNHVKQIFIEFHHHAFKKYKRKHTKQIVANIKKMGFSAFTRDGNNYLFYLPENAQKTK